MYEIETAGNGTWGKYDRIPYATFAQALTALNHYLTYASEHAFRIVSSGKVYHQHKPCRFDRIISETEMLLCK